MGMLQDVRIKAMGTKITSEKRPFFSGTAFIVVASIILFVVGLLVWRGIVSSNMFGLVAGVLFVVSVFEDAWAKSATGDSSSAKLLFALGILILLADIFIYLMFSGK